MLPSVASSQSIFKDGFEGGAGGGPIPPVCWPAPQGFTVYQRTWGQVWYNRAWPLSPSFLTPIGSWTMRSGSGVFRYGRPAAGLVLTVPILTDAATNKLSWVGAQPIPGAGYGTAQAAERITVNVSECKGDLYAKCSYSARSAQLFYGPNAADPKCRFPAFSNLFVTWHLAQADLNPMTNTCDTRNPSLGIRCDANFTATASGPEAGSLNSIIDTGNWTWLP